MYLINNKLSLDINDISLDIGIPLTIPNSRVVNYIDDYEAEIIIAEYVLDTVTDTWILDITTCSPSYKLISYDEIPVTPYYYVEVMQAINEVTNMVIYPDTIIFDYHMCPIITKNDYEMEINKLMSIERDMFKLTIETLTHYLKNPYSAIGD